MLLVYTNQVTPRLTYVFKHIFTRILNIRVDFTTKIEAFIAHDGLKLSYTRQALGNEFFVQSTDLLFNQGIDYLDIQVTDWKGVPVFFQVNPSLPLPFDIFAATFYLLSRYEEYLPHVKDTFERYPAEESLAYQHKFLDKPVVDIWAYRLRDLLKEKFPDYPFKKRRFDYIASIDIDLAYKYKHKGIVRTIGGYLTDLFRLDIQNSIERSLVLFKLKRDPFDTYSWLLRLQKKYKVPFLFFFSMGDYSSFDKNISYNNQKYRMLIKDIADYADVGLHPSYYTMKNDARLVKEKKRLEQIVNFPITKSRQHYLRIALPETYQNLIDAEITEDYTMGYASHYGFRAGTCTPFYFYDLDFEIQTPLKVFPFAVMDGTLKDYLQFTTKKSFDIIYKLVEEVKNVDGLFISIFHNESISGTGRWVGWHKHYDELLKWLSETKEGLTGDS